MGGGVNTHSLKSFIESGTQGMIAIIPCRIFVFWFSLSKNIKIEINTTIILLLLCTGLKLRLTMKEVHRLRVFENRVPRNIFGPKRGEVTGEWRRLHNEELCDLFSTPNIIQAIK